MSFKRQKNLVLRKVTMPAIQPSIWIVFKYLERQPRNAMESPLVRAFKIDCWITVWEWWHWRSWFKLKAESLTRWPFCPADILYHSVFCVSKLQCRKNNQAVSQRIWIKSGLGKQNEKSLLPCEWALFDRRHPVLSMTSKKGNTWNY